MPLCQRGLGAQFFKHPALLLGHHEGHGPTHTPSVAQAPDGCAYITNDALERLARVARMSASYLKTLFRRATGMPLHRYVVQRRVERARTLLERGDLPTSQIALEAGFAHQSHLARWMRRLLGVTPSAIVRAPRSRLVRPRRVQLPAPASAPPGDEPK